MRYSRLADAEEFGEVAKVVMDGERASLLFTSPPYGNQRDYTTGGIGNWDALMQGVFGHVMDVVAECRGFPEKPGFGGLHNDVGDHRAR